MSYLMEAKKHTRPQKALRKLSIVICTYNRYVLLEKNISTLEKLGYPQSHEILVVDNSSDEEGRRCFEQTVLPKYPWLRYIFSSPPGLSRARNAGLEAATHDIVAFLDDDAYPLPGWAEAVGEAFSDPCVAYVGGKIELDWETCRPFWLPPEYDAYYTELDWGNEGRPLSDGEWAAGANLAIKRGLALRAGGFALNLGRIGENLLSNEETALCDWLRQEGYIGFYEPKAMVRHFVPRERISKNWLMRRVAWQGFSEYAQSSGITEYFKERCLQSGNDAIAGLVKLISNPPDNPAKMAELLLFARTLGGLLFLPVRDAEQVSDTPARFAGIADAPIALFVDFTTHEFLYNCLGSSRTAKYCVNNLKEFNPWADKERLVRETKDVLSFCRQRNIRNVFFMTITPYFHLPVESLHVLKGSGLRLFGVLHEPIPANDTVTASATFMSKQFERFFVFHEECKSLFDNVSFGDRLSVMPHPPSLLHSMKNYPPQRRTIPPDGKITLGFLGELREGKGYQECAGMLCRLPRELRSSLRCLFAGGSRIPGGLEKICGMLFDAGIETSLVGGDVRDNYRVISDSAFAQAILETDVVCLPYHGANLMMFSGVFTDGLMAGATFIATDSSLMGRILEREKLGFTFSLDMGISTPNSQASLLKAIADAREFVQSETYAVNRQRFLDSYLPEKIEDILPYAVKEG